MGWDEILGSMGAREVVRCGGSGIERAGGIGETKRGAAGAGEEDEICGLGCGEVGVIGL